MDIPNARGRARATNVALLVPVCALSQYLPGESTSAQHTQTWNRHADCSSRPQSTLYVHHSVVPHPDRQPRGDSSHANGHLPEYRHSSDLGRLVYTGLDPEDVEIRLTTSYEKLLTTLVDNIEHLESTSYNGPSIVKIYLQPGTSLDRANSQVVSASQAILRLLPPSTQPPEIINFSASSVPILQLGLSGQGMSEQQLNDLGVNFLRTQLVTVPGAVVPLPYGGKQRQVMINMDQNLLQAKGLSPADVLNAVNAQNLILPSGTAKVAESELDVRMNVARRTIGEATSAGA
jgi:AcrB/AcrD/AcrF family